MYRPPNWTKNVEPVLERIPLYHRLLVDSGADAMLEGLKAEGRYYPLHRTFKPPGYKQPIRAPGWVVFIPAQTGGDKGGEIQHAL